jgi:uncharacterized protein (DUF1501 family)
MQLTRRAMIKDGLLVVSAGMIMPAVFSRAVRAAHAASREGSAAATEATNRTLIVVQMAGGNDGLNTVVPYTDPRYHQARPTIGIAANDVLALDDRLGLHPMLQTLKALWDEGHVAIVEGVGYPNQSLSHFQAMDIWQTLDLQGQGHEGWLGRYAAGLVDRDGHPFRTLDVGTELPLALQAINTPVPVVPSVNVYRLFPGTRDASEVRLRAQALMSLYDSYPQTAPYAVLLDGTAHDAQASVQQLQQADSTYRPAVTYPKGPFATGLKLLAEVICQGLGLRVGYITLGGFDTHAGQQSMQPRLLQTFAEGVSAFYQDLVSHGKADDVVIMTWSEFGRRVEENASAGTDHGTAAPLFVIGNAVTRGIYGEPPDLGSLDENGNLKYTTDFRSIYATVLDRWLGAPSEAILGGRFTAQGFLPVAS